MQISVSTYSFRRYLKSGEMQQIDCLKRAAEMGFDGIEISNFTPPEGMDIPKYASQLREEAEKYGLKIPLFLCNANFLKEGEELKEEKKRLKGLIDAAKILGVPCMRHDVSVGDGKTNFHVVLPKLAAICREITEYAGERGIKTCVENHGYFCQGRERLEALYAAVNHENFGLLLDMGNFLFSDDVPAVSLGALLEQAFHVHAKDFHVLPGSGANPGRGYTWKSRSGQYLRGAIIGHGDVDVMRCVSALHKNKYDGFVGIEFEGIEEPFEGIAIGLENLRRYIAGLTA